jgi:hypothetical protein
MFEMLLVADQRAVRQLSAAGPHPPLHDRVHPGHLHAAADYRDSSVGENRVEQRRVLPVPIADQVPARPGVLHVHDQVPRGLDHSGGGRVCGSAEDPDAAAGVFDDGEDVQACPGQGDGLDEVAGQ